MRKVLVVLLAALLLLSFTSCNQDKIDDLEAQVAQEKADREAAIKNYEDFCDTFRLALNYQNAYDKFLESNKGDNIEVKITKGSSNLYYFNSTILLTPFITLEDGEKINIKEISDASGTITGKNNPRDADLTIKDNIIKYKYDIKKDDTIVKEDQEITLVLNGTFAYKQDSKSLTMSCNITINDKKYVMSFEKDTVNAKYTAAKVNGNDVELRLLNAGTYAM